MSGREEGRPFGEEQAEKKRQGEGRESEEPKRQKVNDKGDSGDDATCNIGIFLEKYFFNGNGLGADNPAPDEGQAIRGLCSYFTSDGPLGRLPNDFGHITAEVILRSSEISGVKVQATIQRLFSDNYFCYADVLPFCGVRARIRELYKLFGELFADPCPVEDTVLVLCKSFMRFFSDRDSCYDHILPPHQVQARIKDFLQSLHGNTSPDDSISYVFGSRESPGDSMSYLPHFPDSSARGVDGGIFKAAEAFIRVWKFMDMCLDIPLDDNGEGRNWRSKLFSTLHNCSRDYFKSELQVYMTIQDVAALLRCSPYSLGINEYGGGMVAGLISIVKADPAKDQDNVYGSCRYPIPDDLERVATLHLNPIGAKNIIVVEQREVFEELAVNHVFERTRSIIISSLGYPDTATRSPVGLDILYTYKVLSIGKGLNARRFVCNVKWLGPRGDVVEKIPRCQLNQEEIKIAPRLILSGILEVDDERDLKQMIWYSDKAETGALYSLGFHYLEQYLTEKIKEALKEKTWLLHRTLDVLMPTVGLKEAASVE
ncbi:hypothetical protein PTKIN_Ptkin11bG0145800 [Pterospermum kingtungense]